MENDAFRSIGWDGKLPLASNRSVTDCKRITPPTKGSIQGGSSGLALGQGAIERLGRGRRPDPERRGKGLGTTFVYSQRLGATVELLIDDHEALVEHLREVVQLQRLQMAFQSALPVADLLPV